MAKIICGVCKGEGYVDFPITNTTSFVEAVFTLTENMKKGLSGCCGVKVRDGEGCSACKTCSQCDRFLGCWNMAGYKIIKDEKGRTLMDIDENGKYRYYKYEENQ